MAEVYRDGGVERVPDDGWILRAHAERWVALTKDYSIIRDHVDTLADTTLRVFSLNNANITGPQMAERFDLHLNRIGLLVVELEFFRDSDKLVGDGPVVVILSNPPADPDRWARPHVDALVAAGYRAVTFVHSAPD